MGHQATFSMELASAWTSKAGFGQIEKEVGLQLVKMQEDNLGITCSESGSCPSFLFAL